MNRRQSGFTLIELMIAVAIIGIIAAIAMPMYSDYTQRTKVTGALAGIAGIKNQVSLCIQDTGDTTGCSASTNGISPDIAAGEVTYIVSTNTVDGQITLVTEALAGDGVTNLQLVIAPSTASGSAISWDYDVNQNGCVGKTPGRGINCTQ